MKLFSQAGSQLFSGKVKIVDPELTTDRAAFREAADVQDHQLAVGAGGELTVRRFPESGLFEFVAVVVHGLAVRILNGKVRAAGAFHLAILVIGGKFVGRIRLHGNELEQTRVVNAGTVKSNHQRAPATVEVAGIERQGDAGLLLILPVEAA